MLNKVILIGTLGKDPEIRSTGSGKKVANLSLATSESYKDKNGERVETTEWHDIAFWGASADVIEKYLKKGSKLYVEGKIKTEKYEKDGQTRYNKKIIGEKFTMMGGGKKEEGKPEGVSASNDESEDLPF
jgi:single-strand DNA-binding protein